MSKLKTYFTHQVFLLLVLMNSIIFKNQIIAIRYSVIDSFATITLFFIFLFTIVFLMIILATNKTTLIDLITSFFIVFSKTVRTFFWLNTIKTSMAKFSTIITLFILLEKISGGINLYFQLIFIFNLIRFFYFHFWFWSLFNFHLI